MAVLEVESEAAGGGSLTRATDSIGYAHDPSSWAMTWGRGRKRALLFLFQGLGAASIAALAVVVAFVMRFSWPQSMMPFERTVLNAVPLLLQVVAAPEFRAFLPLLMVSPVVHLLLLHWLQLYKPHVGDARPFGETLTVLKGALAGTAVLMALAYTYHTARIGAGHLFEPLFFLYTFMLVFFGVLVFHSGSLILVLLLHALGLGRTRTAIIHAGADQEHLVQVLSSPSTGYTLLGGITLSKPAAREETGGMRCLGELDELAGLVNRHALDEVVLSLDPGLLSMQQRLDVTQTCWRMGVGLKMVPPFRAFFQTGARPEMIGDIPLLIVENHGIYARLPQLLKRLMDFLVSSTVLAAASPVMILAALAVKLSSPGPVFFVQERVGLNGRTFPMFKFRSMRADANAKAHQEYLKQLIGGKQAPEADGESKPIYKMTRDPRITAVGRFIRKTSIDELPQLFNVLRGEMSLVGPRPPIPYEVDEYQDWHMKRLHIRPGMTGLWQVSGRSRLSFEQMVQLDITYIEQWSLWFDIKILFRTVPVVLNIGQAY